MAYNPGRSDTPLEDSGDGVDSRLIVRLVIGAVIVIFTLLFIAQNSDRVETSFVFFTVETRLWVSLLLAVILGAVLGQAAEVLWHRRKARRNG